MTALPALRRKRTLIGAVLAAVLVLLAAGLTALGANTVVNSKAGEEVEIDTRPVVFLPDTDNAALAIVDDENRLTSLVVITLLPSGTGGSIVTVPVNADTTVGFGDVRVPLDGALDVQDPDAFFEFVEATLAISLQFGEIATGDRVEQLLGPIPAIEVELPVTAADPSLDAQVSPDDDDEADDETDNTGPVDDEASGESSVVEGGSQELDLASIVSVLLSHDDAIGSAGRHANDVEIWSALAAASPAIAVDLPVDEYGRAVPSADLDEVVARLWSGPVQVRDLAVQSPAVDGDVDAVVLDRRDVLLVFAQISPARVSTPNVGPVFRLEVPLTDSQIEDAGDLFASRTELGLSLVGDLLFLQANVMSFDGAPSADGAPTVTRIEVANESFLETMEDLGPLVFGESRVVVADELIDGADVVVRLGTGYVDARRAESQASDAVEPDTVDADG